MNNGYVYIGRITNTHGLKGEVKIKSNFDYKDRVFKKGFTLYIGKDKIEEVINTYRPHQEYDMVTLCGIDNIDDALKYKGSTVFVAKEDLLLLKNEYVDEDYLACDCYFNNELVGMVSEIINSGNGNFILCLTGNKFIPKNDNFIEKLDVENKKLYLKNVEGLIWK